MLISCHKISVKQEECILATCCITRYLSPTVLNIRMNEYEHSCKVKRVALMLSVLTHTQVIWNPKHQDISSCQEKGHAPRFLSCGDKVNHN